MCPTPNSDEDLVASVAPFIGNFHKTLPHNEYGEVDVAAYRRFQRVCVELEAGEHRNFDEVASGPLTHTAQPAQSAFDPSAIPALTQAVAKFTSPLAGASKESLGPDPKQLEMPPAPGCRSLTASAEMVELYYMALLRDAPLLAFQSAVSPSALGGAPLAAHNAALGYVLDQRVNDAQHAVNAMFDIAVSNDTDPGRLRTPTDVPSGAGGAGIVKQTLFRSGLHDEQFGPIISQFFLHTIGYGTQLIDPKQVPYAAKRDYLTSHGDWLLAQNTGKDRFGRDYGSDNHYSDQLYRGAHYYPTTNGLPGGPPIKRYISTMRDLARFVNRDALHQAYFNATLFLLGIGAREDAGNPYAGNRFAREGGFATLGGPDLLTLVSEVASRALKVVWRQKWLVHRRCRPEVMAGLIQMQRNGFGGNTRDYGLPSSVPNKPAFQVELDKTLAAVSAHNAALNGTATGTHFLPMAFSAGSPPHPAYGAGHATVAGACVTTLKAWFDEDQKLVDVYAKANQAAAAHAAPKDPPQAELKLLQPGYRHAGPSLENFYEPEAYTAPDAQQMTVGGELNKLASNVAMGRSMGGVHWRTDNTRSLRLGEQIAIEILRKRTAEYAELPLSFTFRSFDGQSVHITRGKVTIG
jgi:hypothetical protein